MATGALKFSWRLNYSWIKMLLTAIFPGIAISMWSGELFWLTSSFLAVCSILPYTTSHSSRKLVFLNFILICILIYLIVLALKYNWYYLFLIMTIIALVAGMIENIHPDLRTFAVWLIIGSIYGGEWLSRLSLDAWTLGMMFILTMVSLGFVVLFFYEEVKPVQFKLVLPPHPWFIFNFKYVLPVIITILIWHIFQLEEPQWIFWSSLSVVYTNFAAAVIKLEQRVYGVLMGAGAGLLISFLLPHNELIIYICFTMIMLSIRMFADYFPGFLVRCFFVVLYAGSLSTHVAIVRLTNVIVGGIVGILCTFLLIKVYQSKLKSI